MNFHFLCIFSPLLLGMSQSANILGFLPFYGTSHSRITLPFLEELARRGHNVTVAGYFEPKNPPPNYKTILFKPLPGTQLRGFLSVEDFRNSYYMSTMYLINRVNNDYNELIQQNKFDRIFEEKVDLVILEYFESELFSAYASRFGVPYILLHTCEPFPWHRSTLADEYSPSIVPQVFSGRTIDMDFSERFWNTIEVGNMMFYYLSTILPNSQRIAERFLGPVPPVDELMKNASLYLVNVHTSLYGPRPTNPSTIEIGGVHIFPPNPLPAVSH
ncbi:UDP-glycosyltransferase activity [Nesidiocoris tenuis]|uniref:UDP-glycosyltransferase activity n=2 Tax=Nesidiocoris tenuis TaxID=355587 RepID=A0ABN7AP60_9HEMI|nr:UDP-glycosyltransferase activity [Nesidiocoris tenuis]